MKKLMWMLPAMLALSAACGRTELEEPEDARVPDADVSDTGDVADADADAMDVPDVPDASDASDADVIRCRTNAECADMSFCNGTEQCVAGVCVPGRPVVCDDGVACTADSCNESTGACEAAADNTRCMLPAICDVVRGCVATPCVSNAECNDGNACNGTEECRGGSCASGPPLRCDDGIDCTDDRCDPRGGCQSAPNNARCDDGVFCNGVEQCSLMVRGCVGGTAMRCDDGDACTMERCDEASRTCRVIGTTDEDMDGFGPLRCPGGRDCDDRNPRVNPGTPEDCRDGVDNNCDGLTDCADRACAGTPACVMCVPTGPEGVAGTCNDGRDNDCNGAIDCADRACAAQPECTALNEDCRNPRVISLPGSVSGTTAMARDDFTPTCASSMGAGDLTYVFRNPVRQTVTIDTIGSSYDTMLLVRRDNCMGPDLACDDDSGGGVSSRIVLTNAEPGTYFVIVDGFAGNRGAFQLRLSVGPPSEVCDNGRDDDGDGAIDCADPDCAMFPSCGMCIPTARAEFGACTNGRDDDCDGLLDCRDPDCAADRACVMCVPTGPENTDAACGDGRDNDCDGRIDCLDPECAGRAMCACVITGPENCSNGRDDDCDRLVDCADPDCRANPVCMMCVPTGPENTDASCADGADNDCDGVTDCRDPGCGMTAPCRVVPPNDRCSGAQFVGVPSVTTGTTAGANGDFTPTVAGFPGCSGGAGADVVYTFSVRTRTALTIDLAGFGFDPVLYVRRTPCEAGAQVACNDNAVGGDSRVAMFADPGQYFVFVDGATAAAQGAFRLSITLGLPAEDCGNGRDDDADGAIDCGDSDCSADPRCSMCVPTGAENTAATCRDGRDNNCDGRTDCADPGCRGLSVCCMATGPETTVAACTDGIDNDCDGLSDCADDDCSPLRMVGGTECCNGRDDDGNGVVDEFACRCSSNTQCAGIGVGGPLRMTSCYLTLPVPAPAVCGPDCRSPILPMTFCSDFLPGSRCDMVSGACVR
ncbi:MAG: MopE-related protein [Deltaproteobacteria bacterium]|nr:MopE-related protein [Deltaproteobacteria bacterium]